VGTEISSIYTDTRPILLAVNPFQHDETGVMYGEETVGRTPLSCRPVHDHVSHVTIRRQRRKPLILRGASSSLRSTSES
jgi:hypothetical protein